MELTDRPTRISRIATQAARLSRRALLGGMLATAGVGLLAACAGPAPAASSSGADALSTVRFQFNWGPDVEWGSWYLGESDGYFSDAGVPVELLHGGPNTPAVTQVVAAGQADIGVASDELEILQANAQGADFVVIGAMYQRSPFGYTWLTESGISSPEDLVGQRIGGTQGDQVRIDAVFKVNGLPVDYTFVPMGYDPQPLVNGEMVAITSYITNQPLQLRNEGHDASSATFSDFGLKSYGDVLFASRKYLDEHRPEVVAALKGLIAATEANIADPSRNVDLTVDNYGKDSEVDPKHATEANATFIELLSSDYTDEHGLLSVDPDYMENEIFTGFTAAGLTDLPAVSDFVDTSFMEEAHK